MDARIDVAAMNAGAPHTSDDVMADNGTGTVTVFLVDNFRRVRIEDRDMAETRAPQQSHSKQTRSRER